MFSVAGGAHAVGLLRRVEEGGRGMMDLMGWRCHGLLVELLAEEEEVSESARG